MLLIQCFGRTDLARRLAAQSAYMIQPCDALLAALVDDVALFLDVRGFGQVAQPVVPRDALLAVLVDHVPLFLQRRRNFGQRRRQVIIPRVIEAPERVPPRVC